MGEAARALVHELVDEARDQPLGPWEPRELAVGEILEAWLSTPTSTAYHVWSVTRVEGSRAYLVRATGPQPGPQQQLVDCEADLAFYGGGAGSGKTWLLLYDLGLSTHVRGFRAVLFRRTTGELTGGGGPWDESLSLFPRFGGRSRQSPTLDWFFPNGARVELRHLQLEQDVQAHHGRQYAVIVFDELQTFSAFQFWYLLSRLRSTCGVRPYVRASCNPDPDSFVYDFIAWWLDDDGFPIPERSGVIRWFVRVDEVLHWYDTREAALAAHPGWEPLSFTFIAAKLDDNRILVENDPSYRAKLLNMNRVERARLYDGNWKVRATAGEFFRREDFQRADEPPSRIVRTVRAWDKAATAPSPSNPRPDWTRGVRMSLCEDGEIWIDDLESERAGPVDVLKRMRAIAERDGVGVTVVLWQDTGGAGVVDVQTTQAALSGFETEVVQSWTADKEGVSRAGHRSSRAKRAFARVWAPWVEQGRVYIARGAPWAAELLAECDSFPDGSFDDIVDAISAGAQVLGRERGTSLLEAMAAVTLR